VAAPTHTISTTVDVRFNLLVVPPRLREIARIVLEEESVPTAELGIFIAGEEDIRELNRKYAGEDEATDVLSFSLREGEEFVEPDGLVRLGEVIIAYPVAQRQAEDASHPIEEEVGHLLVHGILHLLGYDHAQPDDERVMGAREEELLRAVGAGGEAR